MFTKSVLRPLAVMVFLTAAVVGSASPTSAESSHFRSDKQPNTPSAAGMVIVESNQTFEESWTSLLNAVEGNPNLTLIHTVDHAAAAEAAGLELAPNRVAIFANENLIAPVVQANQLAAIDLPQKIQIFEQDGKVWVGFNDPLLYLDGRFGLDESESTTTMNFALRTLTGIASGGEFVEDESASAERFTLKPALTTVESDADIDATWDRLLAAIDASPVDIAFQVDNEATAATIGLEVRPTRLVVFGNPNLGTPLMAEEPTAGMDLPVKFLVWEDEDGRTFVTTNSGRLYSARHDLNCKDLTSSQMALEGFLAAATTS